MKLKLVRKSAILLLLFITVFSNQNSIFAQPANESDSLELIKLYNATNGAGWVNKWGLAWPVQYWDGITLNDNGRVSAITLGQNNLIGVLPNLNLPDLEVLDLYNNQLSGSIPNFKLPVLRNLSLTSNDLSGQIPNFDFPALEYLDLSYNHLNDTIPNFNLPSLQSLHLNANQLNGLVPNFKLPILKNLYLNYNELSGAVPRLTLSALVWLDLFHNRLSDTIPDFNLPNLEVLSLGENNLTGTIPNFNLPALTHLDLANNHLTGKIPNFNIPALNSLFLSGNELGGTVPELEYTSIFNLKLDYNSFTFDGMESLVVRHPSAVYSPQAIVKVNVSNGVLGVSVGGTLANNTYIWLKNGQQIASNSGVPTLDEIGDGQYSVIATNFVAWALTLYSDTLSIVNHIPVYNFIRTGNWDEPTNWAGNSVPPSILTSGEIIINPLSDGECVLNVPITVSSGAKLTVAPGKKFIINGNLEIKQ